MHLVASRKHRLVERGDILCGRHSFQDRICDYGSRIVAHHAAAVARRGPFGQEAALAVGVGQPGLNLGVDRRVDQVQQREQTPERIPETRVGIHIARQHLAVIGAVMHRIAFGVDLVEFAREQGRAVEARIEGPVLLFGAARDLDPPQHLVPALLRTGFHRLEIGIADLGFEVAQSLLSGDERRGHARRHLLAAAGGEIDRRKGMFAFGLETFQFVLSVEYPKAAERLVEADDEPVAEIVGHAAAVARGVSYDGAAVGHDFDLRPAVEGVDHHARFVRLGKGEAQHGGAIRRSHFGHDIVVGQIDQVIIGLRRLRLVGEPALARIFINLVFAAHGHDGKLSVIVDPRRGLVRLLQAPDRVRSVGVGPAVAHLARLGRPEVHAPRQGHGRIGVARRKRVVGLCAHERRDVFRRAQRNFVFRGFATAPGQSRKKQQYEVLHFFIPNYRIE